MPLYQITSFLSLIDIKVQQKPGASGISDTALYHVTSVATYVEQGNWMPITNYHSGLNAWEILPFPHH